MSAEDRIREVVDAYLARIRQDLDTHAQAMVADLSQVIGAEREAWRAETDRQVAEVREDNARQLVETSERARVAAEFAAGQRESRIDTLERLMSAVRRIDESHSLTGILGALLRGTAAETSRVAILLVDGYMFRTWEHSGFEDGAAPTEMPIGAAGTLAAAVALKQPSFVPPVIEGREDSSPGFMRVPAGHTGLVVPLMIGGDVVAVLYADDASRAVAQEDVPLWTEEVQLLARHAAIRLENVTSVRTVEVLAGTD